MKRFELEITDHDGISAEMIESPDGEFVKYEDALKLIDALKKIESACPSEWKQDLKAIARQALKEVGHE